jgi:hypothetical protein
MLNFYKFINNKFVNYIYIFDLHSSKISFVICLPLHTSKSQSSLLFKLPSSGVESFIESVRVQLDFELALSGFSLSLLVDNVIIADNIFTNMWWFF